MASPSTRSSRRAEGLSAKLSNASHQNNAYHHPSPANPNRRKRLRDSAEHEKASLSTKKARISIEIEARSIAASRNRRIVVDSNASLDVFPPRSANKHITAQSHAAKARLPTKHSEKVANGISHELNKLQPSEADRREEKRKLRSQEGTRFKSELSAYFPDYDVVIGNEPEETHFLNIETPIIITDSNPSLPKPQLHTPPKPRQSKNKPVVITAKVFSDTLFHDLHNSQVVDFAFLDKHSNGSPQSDPLPDSLFDLAHRRAERLERSIRNSEKGRAQHEKDQVIRLLEGLQGHDWLKVMGVSGITESKKKEYEPAREYFLQGCQAIIEKFRTWRDEEKRRKVEKDRQLAEAAEEEEEAEEHDEGEESDGDPPDYSDVDHAAARQLHEEAIARSAPLALSRSAEKKAKVEIMSPEVEKLEKDFKSFYSKPYLRAAAIGKHRRSGRSVSAWGQPVPEMLERDFDLPEEYRDVHTLEVNARRKRRYRRESKD